MDSPQDSPWLRRLPACIATLACCLSVSLVAQGQLRATVAVPFHKDPRGIQLGTLVAGTTYRTGPVRDSWVEATVEGWIWTASVEPTTRDGFDLTVIADTGESLRAEPNGTVIARFTEGTLLHRVTARGGWTQVRRSGWVSRASLSEPEPRSAKRSQPESTKTAQETASKPDSTPKSAARVDSTVAGAPAGSKKAALRKGAELLTAPDGERVANLSRAGAVEVAERSGDWVKVRFEAWVRSREFTDVPDETPRITAQMLRDDGRRYVGDTVSWRLHYLGRREADDLRPEMPKGQPYILARGPLPEVGFVYLMITKAQANQLVALQPLDEIRVDVIIRAPKTKYLPTPVVELVKVDR